MMDTDVIPVDWIPENSIIKVIGVGGGGCNAVNYMYKQKIEGCTFIVCNTDRQALDKCEVPVKIQLGARLGDRHKVSDYSLVCYCDRSAALDLLAEERDDRAV